MPLLLQERLFLTISNYIFTAIFVGEMTLKVKSLLLFFLALLCLPYISRFPSLTSYPVSPLFFSPSLLFCLSFPLPEIFSSPFSPKSFVFHLISMLLSTLYSFLKHLSHPVDSFFYCCLKKINLYLPFLPLSATYVLISCTCPISDAHPDNEVS